jgi:hypothetical protein
MAEAVYEPKGIHKAHGAKTSQVAALASRTG